MKSKTVKKIGIIVACVAVGLLLLAVSGVILIDRYWSGDFNHLLPHEIAVFKSPDEQYILTYYQLGEPEFPFGATDVRLTLMTADGENCDSLDTEIHNDGANAGEGNIKAIEWTKDAAVVTLCASEMEDKTVTLTYK